MKEYRLEHAPLVYYISGKAHKEWVLFLHAAFVNHNMFQTQSDGLQNKYNILTLDIIGHGKSVDTKKGDSINQMSRWVYEILKAEQIQKIHVVGVSLGAVLAQNFADQYPEAVQSLACFGGYDIHNFPKQMQKENSSAQMRMMLKAMVSVPWFAKANQKISAYTAQAQKQFYDMNIQFPKKSFMYLSSLSKMVNVPRTHQRTYPLLIGCGTHDIPAELTAVELWHKNEPDSKLIIFENAGHCVNMDAPQQFNTVLEHFWTDSQDSSAL